VGSKSVSSGLGGPGFQYWAVDRISGMRFLVLLNPFRQKPEYYFTLSHELFHPHYSQQFTNLFLCNLTDQVVK